MKSRRFHWLSLLLFSLSLLLWYNHMNKSGVTIVNMGLHGYVSISPERGSQFLALHCSGCAVVSSSGQMLGSGRGGEIDGQPCVLRMNTAPTQGFEADVGNRTTVRMVSHTSVPHLLRQEEQFFRHAADTLYVVWGPEKNMRQDGKGHVFNTLLKMAQKYPHAHIYVVTREKVDYCDRVFQNETGKDRMKSGAYLSTGFFTMILALDVCESVQVYGMIDASYCSRSNRTSVPYHYYETARLDECGMYGVHERARRGGHRFITEKTIYRRWASNGKLRFRHPS